MSRTSFFTLALIVLLCTAPAARAGRFAAASSHGIENRYLVLLADSPPSGFRGEGLPLVQEVAGDVLREHGIAGPLRIYEHAVRGFAVEMTEQQARRLARDPRIAEVEQDRLIEVQAPICPDVSFPAASVMPTNPQPVPCLITASSCAENWGLDRIDQSNQPLDGSFHFSHLGTGVNIYFLDTGLDYLHTEFKNAAGASRVGLSINFASNVNGNPNAIDPNNYYDGYGHGTHIAAVAAGLRYGVAKNANLHAVRVTDNNAVSSTSLVMSGVDWIAGHYIKPAVVNISMNFSVARETTVDPGHLNLMEQSFHNLVATYGVPVVNSAGNFNQDAVYYSPSRMPELIVIGATDNADARWAVATQGQPCYLRSDPYSQCGSNFGPYVDLFAPGFGIVSAWTNTSTRTGACQELPGTSMAAAFASGVAALYLETHPTALPSAVEQALISNASSGVLYPQNLGAGSPNRMLKTFYP
jgi:Subtilase family/Peptidase inhibitor I9